MTVNKENWTLRRIVVAGASALINAHHVAAEHPRPLETPKRRQARASRLARWQWSTLRLRERLNKLGNEK